MTDVIQKSTDIAAPVERVWRALTDHEEFGRWFGVHVEAPFTEGEPSRGHITYPGYEHVEWDALIERLEPPRQFSFRWHPYAIERGVDYSAEPRTLVEFTLEAIASGTRLTVVESGFDAIPVHRRADCLRMNEGGWTEQMVAIRNHVED